MSERVIGTGTAVRTRSWSLPRFPNLVVDLALIGAAALIGAFLGQLFQWEQLDAVGDIHAWQIFVHNGLLACLGILLTGPGARGMMLLNGLWMGMGIMASLKISGVEQTVGLIAVHIPLEVMAWAMTIELARRFWPTVIATVRREPVATGRRRDFLAHLAPTALVYGAAALTEWLSFILIGR